MQQPSVSKDGTSAVSEQNADEKVASTSGIVSGDEIFGRTSSTGSRASKTAASKTRKKASKSTFNDDSRAVALPGGRLVSGPDDTGLMPKALSKQKSLISSSTLFAHEQATLPRLGSGRDIAGMMADQAQQGRDLVNGEEQPSLAGTFDLADYDRISIRTKKLVGKKMQKNGSGSILNRLTGIGPKVGGLPGSTLIHPFSPFAQFLAVFSTILLFYSAITSSVNAGFYWTASTCFKTPTLEMDMAVDVFFILEIFLHFFQGKYIAGQYVDKIPEVAKYYLYHGFWFDCATSIPASWLEWANLAFNCDASGIDQDGGASLLDEDQAFRILRSVKPLRIFRMLKTLKAVAAINIGSIYGSSTAIMLAQTFRIPSFVLRVGQVLFVLSLLVHTSACMFWLIKTDVTPADEIDDWMIRNNLSIHLHASLSEKYVAAVYFVFTIFTTVGFGDMVPESTSERLYIIFLFYISMLGFGALLAEVQDAMMQRGRNTRIRSGRISGMIDFLRESECPQDMEAKIVSWMNFDLECHQTIEARLEILHELPPNLSRDLQRHLYRDLNFISFMSDVHDVRKQAFVNEIHKSMTEVTYPAMAPITSIGDPADRMFFIQSGSVNVSLEDGSILSTLHKGEAFGEASLLGCTEWVLGSRKVQYISTDYSLLSYVTVSDFLRVAKAFGGDILEQVETCREEFKKKHRERLMKGKSMESGSDDSEGNTVVLIRWFELKKRLIDLDRRITRETLDHNSSEFLMDKLSASAAKLKNKNKIKSPGLSTNVHMDPVAPMTLRRRLSNVAGGATSDSAASKLHHSDDLVCLTKKVEEMNSVLKAVAAAVGAKVPITTESEFSVGLLDDSYDYALQPNGNSGHLHSCVAATPKPHGGGVHGDMAASGYLGDSQDLTKVEPMPGIAPTTGPASLEAGKAQVSSKIGKSTKTKKSKKRQTDARDGAAVEMSRRSPLRDSREEASAADAQVAAQSAPADKDSGVMADVFHAVEGFGGLFAWDGKRV